MATSPPSLVPYTSDNRQQLKWDFSILGSPPTLAAGASFTIQFQAQAGSNVPVSATPYTNDIRVDYNNGSVSTSASLTYTAPVTVGKPLVSLTKTVSPLGDQPPGADLTYSVIVSNTGTAAQSLEIQDIVPAEVDFKLGSVTVNAGTSGTTITPSYSADGGLTWTYTPINGGGGAPAGYDRNVNRVRWNVSPSLSGTSPNNVITVGFTVRIK